MPTGLSNCEVKLKINLRKNIKIGEIKIIEEGDEKQEEEEEEENLRIKIIDIRIQNSKSINKEYIKIEMTED